MEPLEQALAKIIDREIDAMWTEILGPEWAMEKSTTWPRKELPRSRLGAIVDSTDIA